jgi:hypothetical protein
MMTVGKEILQFSELSIQQLSSCCLGLRAYSRKVIISSRTHAAATEQPSSVQFETQYMDFYPTYHHHHSHDTIADELCGFIVSSYNNNNISYLASLCPCPHRMLWSIMRL